MRDMPYTHQLETGVEPFLAQLTLPGDAGRQLQQARQHGDHAAVRTVIADHFRTRGRPAWSFYSHGSPWHQTDAVGSVLDKGRQLLRHRFRNAWAPHQWMDLGNGSLDPDWGRGLEQAPTSIARGTWVCDLTTTFALTGDERYAAKALQLIRSYVQACPFVLDPRFTEDHDAYFGGAGNGTQMISYRLFRWIDLLYSGAMHVPACSDDDVFWLIRQMWFYACQFARLLDDPMRRDNHHLLDHGHTPFVLGMMFPEFAWSKDLRESGAKVIRRHIVRNLLDDGAYAEHSAEYQYHVLFHYLHPHGVARANGYRLFSAAHVKRLREWVKFNARCSKPDGMLPAIGDSPGRPLQHLFGSLAAPVMNRQLAAMARGLGCVPAAHAPVTAADVNRAMKHRQSRRLSVGLSPYYIDTPQPADAAQWPTPATCQYPRGGYTFFRSAWHPDADYLAVSHFTGDYGTHAHWDMMSIILHTRGRTLIGDPAAWLYLDRRFHGHGGDFRKERADTPLHHRGYSYSVNAHNCLVMNDDTLKPLAAMSHGTFWGGWPPRHGLGLFRAGGPIEVAEMWHDANHPTRHRRFVVHVVGVGFVFVDLLSQRPGLAPHQYSQYYHFDAGVRIGPRVPRPGQPLRAFEGDAACLIVPGAETESRWRTFRDPYLDDVYGVPTKRGRPWVAELTRRIRGQAVFAHAILTGRAAEQCGTRCRHLGSQPTPWLGWQTEAISANALDLGSEGTLLVASAPYDRPVQSDVLTTDAELAVVRLDDRGQIVCWAMARGRYLAVGATSLASGRPCEWRIKEC